MNRSHTVNQLTLGVDTHLETHVAAPINNLGQVIDTGEFSVCTIGYEKLLKWSCSFEVLKQAELEGTGTYVAGLCKFLIDKYIRVYEVNRPNRAKRRLRGKSDPTDAENAARSVLAKESTALPKSHDRVVEALRYLVMARKSAVESRTQAINKVRGLLVTSPEDIRSSCYVASTVRCITACKNVVVTKDDLVLGTLLSTLNLLADRWLSLTKELKCIEKQLKELTKSSATRLLEQFAVGPYVAATLMVAAGDNPQRLKKE
jgi:transposase